LFSRRNSAKEKAEHLVSQCPEHNQAQRGRLDHRGTTDLQHIWSLE